MPTYTLKTFAIAIGYDYSVFLKVDAKIIGYSYDQTTKYHKMFVIENDESQNKSISRVFKIIEEQYSSNQFWVDSNKYVDFIQSAYCPIERKTYCLVEFVDKFKAHIHEYL